MGLKDISILEEIGDLYHGLLELDQALIAYKMLATIDPEYPEGLKKYAEVLEDPRCRDQNIDRAIDYYKKCLNLINGDANKGHDALHDCLGECVAKCTTAPWLVAEPPTKRNHTQDVRRAHPHEARHKV